MTLVANPVDANWRILRPSDETEASSEAPRASAPGSTSGNVSAPSTEIRNSPGGSVT